jgi:hypothetical protein
MSAPDTLAPDQRAALELVLRQGRSYGELAELLGIPEPAVRSRAHAALGTLAPGMPGEAPTALADWLLGQTDPADPAVLGALEGSPAAREWARGAAERLRELGGERVPEVPEPADTPPADSAAAPPPRPRPLRAPGAGAEAAAADSPPSAPAAAFATAGAADSPRSSRLGGAIVLAVAAVLIAGFLVWFLRGTDDESEPASQAAAQPTATPTGTPAPQGNDIALRGVGGSEAAGVMRLFSRDDGTVQFALAAENVPPNTGSEVYAVWFTKRNGEARRLGFAQAQVGENGVLTTGGPTEDDLERFPRWFASYDFVVVTRESDADARRPGRAVLRGTLPSGAG